MPNPPLNNDEISSKVEIDYPDFETLPEAVRAKFESLSTKVNFFKMLGHSVGTFIPVICQTACKAGSDAVSMTIRALQ